MWRPLILLAFSMHQSCQEAIAVFQIHARWWMFFRYFEFFFISTMYKNNSQCIQNIHISFRVKLCNKKVLTQIFWGSFAQCYVVSSFLLWKNRAKTSLKCTLSFFFTKLKQWYLKARNVPFCSLFNIKFSKILPGCPRWSSYCQDSLRWNYSSICRDCVKVIFCL